MRTIRRLRIVPFLAAVCVLLASLEAWAQQAAQAPFTPPDDLAFRKADVYSEGVRLTAQLFSLKRLGGARLPTIVMAHGWGGTVAVLRQTAIDFARAGYLVVAFDYRGWGESDSRVILTGPPPASRPNNRFTAEVQEVREVVDPWEELTDWLNVIHWVHGESQVDTDRIGLWGSSYSGGLVVAAAARDHRVKALASQVGAFGYTLVTTAGESTSRAYEEGIKRTRGQLPYPAPRAREVGNLFGGPVRDKMISYDPTEEADRAPDCAMLFVIAEKEELFDNKLHAIKAYNRAKGPKKLVTIPGITHYEIYSKARDEATKAQIDWFDQHLKKR
jgi:dienelactone hydrolase